MTLKWNKLGTSLFKIKARNFKEFKIRVLFKRIVNVSGLKRAPFTPLSKPMIKRKGSKGMFTITNLRAPRNYEIIEKDENGFIQEIVLKPSWLIFIPHWENKPTLPKHIQTAYTNYIEEIKNHERTHKNTWEKSVDHLVKRLKERTDLKKAGYIKIVIGWNLWTSAVDDIQDY